MDLKTEVRKTFKGGNLIEIMGLEPKKLNTKELKS
jgi:hypothetical protein